VISVSPGASPVMELGGPGGGFGWGTGRDLAGPPTCGARLVVVERRTVVVDNSWCDLD
jgi:hypothetical protein